MPHVDLVYLLWSGTDMHPGNFNVSGEVVPRDVFIDRHQQSGLVWYFVVEGPSTLTLKVENVASLPWRPRKARAESSFWTGKGLTNIHR